MSGDGRREGLLVVRCQLGERAAFQELVQIWHAPLWRYVRGMVGSPHLADDLAQDAWVAVVRGLPRLRQPERFAPWLFTIARRTVADHLRQAYQASVTSVQEANAVVDGLSQRRADHDAGGSRPQRAATSGA
ncbi:RNA polymerase sigma factor [Streptomyces sp. AS58]|uniref:RNA polymerase sigma factor n=1 Tax=Streptomyces sp. AS58 TaxID=1519489 RepID=UPI000A5329AB|nr:sigma factor [Streptomyces sp. AS58]